ncbi:MAG: hypothetical protein ACYDC3_20660 [Candidatus Binataceae bacterium]
MKKKLTTFAAMVFVGAMGTVAMAQTPYNGGGYGSGIGATQVNRFDNGYMDQHPGVAQQLGQNPRLVDNAQFMSQHPGLRDYFASHPEVRADLKDHPDRFMNAESGHGGWNHPGNYAHPLANTDHYMDQHPEVAEQLQAHPGLVNDPQYLANHPGLHGFMASHPVARTAWKNHPGRYMQHEDHYNQRH